MLREAIARGIRLAVLGEAMGLAGSFAVTLALRSLLFGVDPLDPVTFVGVSALLLAVAAITIDLTARRTTTVDPAHVLRTV